MACRWYGPQAIDLIGASQSLSEFALFLRLPSARETRFGFSRRLRWLQHERVGLISVPTEDLVTGAIKVVGESGPIKRRNAVRRTNMHIAQLARARRNGGYHVNQIANAVDAADGLRECSKACIANSRRSQGDNTQARRALG